MGTHLTMFPQKNITLPPKTYNYLKFTTLSMQDLWGRRIERSEKLGRGITKKTSASNQVSSSMINILNLLKMILRPCMFCSQQDVHCRTSVGDHGIWCGAFGCLLAKHERGSSSTAHPPWCVGDSKLPPQRSHGTTWLRSCSPIHGLHESLVDVMQEHGWPWQGNHLATFDQRVVTLLGLYSTM